MKLFSRLLSAAVLTASLSASLPALAKSFTIGDPPVAVVTLPDAWKPEEIENGAEANAPGGGAYVAIEAVKIKDVESATREGIKYFQKSGVTIDPATMKQKETKIGPYPAIDITWSGKDKDGATNVSLTFVVMSDTQSVLLYLWGSDDDLKSAASELGAIASSLKAVK